MTLNSQTKLCGVIGHPIKHSLSPLIHNAAYQATKQNYTYLAFDVAELNEAVKAMKTLDIKQYAVTIPYKVEIIDYLDYVDPMAKKIQAVNTVINRDGKLYGYNTDLDGVELTFKKHKINLHNKKIVMIGAGGIARTIGAVIKKAGGCVTVFDSAPEKSLALSKLIYCQRDSLENLNDHRDYDILINATPIGMSPNIKAMPVNKDFIQPKKIIFDVVYNPLNTKLLIEGKKKNCRCINGSDLFIFQAAKQFELLTGKKAPLKIIQKTFLKNI